MGKESSKLYLDRDTVRFIRVLASIEDRAMSELVREACIEYALRNKHQDILIKIFGLDFLKVYKVGKEDWKGG